MELRQHESVLEYTVPLVLYTGTVALRYRDSPLPLFHVKPFLYMRTALFPAQCISINFPRLLHLTTVSTIDTLHRTNVCGCSSADIFNTSSLINEEPLTLAPHSLIRVGSSPQCSHTTGRHSSIPIPFAEHLGSKLTTGATNLEMPNPIPSNTAPSILL